MILFNITIINLINLDKPKLFIIENEIGDIGTKYIGLALSKLIKLTYFQIPNSNFYIISY